jgi:hypothetical protein
MDRVSERTTRRERGGERQKNQGQKDWSIGFRSFKATGKNIEGKEMI